MRPGVGIAMGICLRVSAAAGRRIVGAAAAAALTVALTGPLAAREFRAADIQPEDYPTVQALLFMDRYLRAQSGGQHQISVFHSRQLGEESQTLEQTRVGAIDIDRINAVAIGGIAPEINVLALPFLFRSQDHLDKVVDGPIGEDMLAALDQYGFVGLAFYDSGARSIYANRPVRGLTDLAGLRIRVQQSDLMSRMMEALGVIPVTIPYGQILTALTARLVDGAENNWPSYVTAGHYKSARYYTVTEHVMAPEVVVMSKRVWLSLSAEEQATLRAAARESAKFMRRQWRDWETRSRKQAAESGVIITAEFDRAAFVAAVKPIHDAARADPKMGPLVARILALP